jgi:hypothetical protein
MCVQDVDLKISKSTFEKKKTFLTTLSGSKGNLIVLKAAKHDRRI